VKSQVSAPVRQLPTPAVIPTNQLVTASFTAWYRFRVARAWLAAMRLLPGPLRGFVATPTTGVLCQTGAVYQFRHARLQDHLADISPASHTDR
jgi:hypothetical protein